MCVQWNTTYSVKFCVWTDTQSCNPCHSQDIEQFHHLSKFPSCPFIVTPSPELQPLIITGLFFFYHNSSLSPKCQMNVTWMCPLAHLCPTLCNTTDSSLLGSSLHVIFQARILQWVAWGDLPDAGIEPTSPVLAGGFFTTESPGDPYKYETLWVCPLTFSIHIWASSLLFYR